ncbi:UDP-glucose 4-epimerase [Burkholderia latens]
MADVRPAAIREDSRMTVSGELHDTDWSVAIETAAAETGGFRSRIHVVLESPGAVCDRTFCRSTVHATERDAALDALRIGMTWVEMKKSNTFTV